MRRFLLFISFFAIISSVCAQNARVVGYLPTYRFNLSDQISYCKLTHLNLSFANPDDAGNMSLGSASSSDIANIMSNAKSANPNIVIFVSLAGALSSTEHNNWSNLIDNASNRPAFIQKIVNFVLDNNFDGVDVDLEWNNVTSGYSPFVIELGIALEDQGKQISAALPNWTLFSNITPAALDAFDFINIMAYDATGPWDPNSPGQHSSYSFANSGVNFWRNDIGIEKDRLTLGVPFYGYNFSTSPVSSVTFRQMTELNAAYADIDHVGQIYYNGRPTIQSKVNLGNGRTGGIMIWEVAQDAFNDFSLLATIHDKFTELGVQTTGLCGNEAVVDIATLEIPDFKIYPNPAADYFTISGDGIAIESIAIFNIGGQKVLTTYQETQDDLRFDITGLTSGLYFVSVKFRDKLVVKQLFVK